MLPLSRLSPYSLATPDIREREQELARVAGSLERAVHPATARALRTALAGIHSYYSNLIEGQSTEPIAAELAITERVKPPPGSNAEKFVTQAIAGIRATFRMEEKLRAGADVLSPDFIKFLHFEFTSRLPPEWLWAEGENGIRLPVIPGAFRSHFVKVGLHLPPAPDQVGSLVEALANFPRSIGNTLSSIMLLHHRLAWIHPFLDGNGRTARLFTEAMLLRSPAAGDGLWCLSRGLAKNRDRYRLRLASADEPSRGAGDGRGELSERKAHEFVVFMLDTAIDQAKFMSERLTIDGMKARLHFFAQERSSTLGRDPRAASLLSRVMFDGPVERGAVGEIVGLSSRRAQDITRECINDGLLGSSTEKGKLTPRFPMYALSYLLPSLFPIDNPRTAMREYVSTESTAIPKGQIIEARLADEREPSFGQ